MVDLEVAERHVARVLGDDAVCDVVLQVEVFDHEVATRRYYAVRELAVAFENRAGRRRLVGSSQVSRQIASLTFNLSPAHCDVIDIYLYFLSVATRHYFNRVAGTRTIDRRLNRLAGFYGQRLRRPGGNRLVGRTGVVFCYKLSSRIG